MDYRRLSLQATLEQSSQELTCSFCGAVKERMTIWRHTGPVTKYHKPGSLVLFLCFHGCQHFPEPFVKSCLVREHWERVDPWQSAVRGQPRIRAENGDWRHLDDMAGDHQQG